MIGLYKTIPIPFWGECRVETGNTWYGNPVMHSPKTWPGWRLFLFKFVRTNPDLPRKPGVHSFNFWIYTRCDAICIHTLFLRKGKP